MTGSATVSSSQPVPEAESHPVSAVEIDSITQVFFRTEEQFTAIEDVNFTIAPGEFVSVVGPSGCGKSTLLKIVAGLLKPTGGSVSVRGEPMVKPRRDIGLMFQTPTLFPWRTVERNISLPLDLHDFDDAETARRIDYVLDLVDLQAFRRHYPRELSGGMQQRVALCRLLVSDPVLMLLDEPFGALDEFTRERLNVELSRIATREQKTTMFVTHNIAEAVFLSDRVIVMGTGPGRVVDMFEIERPKPRGLDFYTSDQLVATVRDVRTALGFE